MVFNKFLLASGLSLFASVAAVSAAPTLESAQQQVFSKNSSTTELLELTVTEDSTTPVITQGYIEINIPSDFPAIFDDERSQIEVALSGTAVDDGKASATPDLSFTNQDMTVQIPIVADFEAGDALVIRGLYLEGFYEQYPTSAYLTLQVNGTGAVYTNSRYLTIDNSTVDDRYAPERPTDFAVTNTAEGIELTWGDPTDQDLWLIQVFRGESANVGVSDVYASVLPGEESYMDSAVQVGKTYYYVIRSNDGQNFSAVTTEMSLTATLEDAVDVDETSTETSTDTTTTETDATPDDTTTDDSSDTVAEETLTASELFSDEIPSWAENAITELASSGIVEGNPDGTFGSNDELNRAEAATMLWRVLMMGVPSASAEAPFSDVTMDAWYVDYISNLKDLSLVEGNPDGTYQPAESINRAEFLQLAMNAYNYIHADQELPDIDYTAVLSDAYEDMDDSSSWYAYTVANATYRGFVQGSACGEGMCFNAGDEITRAEASQMLYNIFSTDL